MKLTLQFQYEPEWIVEWADQTRPTHIKGINCFPNLRGVQTLGRVFIDDNLSNELVNQGAAGVPQWMYLCTPEYRKNPHVAAWFGPNEYILDSFEKTARFNEFHVRWIEEMSRLGHRAIAGSINVGWPHLRMFGDVPPYPPAIRPTIETLVKHDGILSLHEYGPGDMRTGVGAYCLRYRNTVEELRARQIPIPKIFIGETGIDVPDPSFPLDHHHRGWREFVKDEDGQPWEDGYIEQLAWYAGELEQDDYVIGAAGFTVCNWDWTTFNFHKSLAMKMAGITVMKPAALWTDISANLPRNGSYDKRGLKKIQRTVIHHSVTEPKDDSPEGVVKHIESIARRHIRIAGWPGIAYHIIIGPKGDAYLVNPLNTAAYHVGWRYNPTSVGVCFLKKGRDPTPEQLISARKICAELGYKVVPHKHLAQTRCPGNWKKWGGAIK